MDGFQKGLCDDCAGRWDRPEFWQSNITSAQVELEEWGDVHCRKFIDIATSRQCALCRLILDGLQARGSHQIPGGEIIYFAKHLFCDLDTNIVRAGSCVDHPWKLQQPYARRYLVNHLCISTSTSRSHISREEIQYVLNTDHDRQTNITLCMEEQVDQRHSLLGRRMGDHFDVDLGMRWIRECEANHGAECLKSGLTFRPSRMLNTKRQCLEYAPPSCSYVALSYRWPRKTSIKLTAATLDQLEKPGGLGEVMNEVALVVRDAIELSLRLGYTYVWIDALCIPQEEDGDHGSRLALERGVQLSSMAEIYQNATITIVACSEDPEKGLSGFQIARAPQFVAEAGDMTFTVCKDYLSEAVNRSQWSTRAWTFREGAIPTRMLIFTEGQVFFLCNTAMYQEDVWEKPRDWKSEDMDLPHNEGPIWRLKHRERLPFPDYADAIHRFSKRKAGRPSDMPKAIRFMRSTSSFCCLHDEHVAHALCFETAWGTRTCESLPTWCWCGWSTPVGIEVGLGGAHLPDYDFQSDIRAWRAVPATPIAEALEKKGFQPANLMNIRAAVLEATLLEKDSIYDGSGCTYKVSLVQRGLYLQEVRTYGRAYIAMDCAKTEGALVYCVHIGRALSIDTSEETAWFLVVEPILDSVYRRIGTGTVYSQNYTCKEDSLQDILLV